MIAVDTSAVVAIAFAEPERDAFVRAIEADGRALISAVSVVEARMVVHGRRGEKGVVLLNDFLRLPVFEWVAPGPADIEAAHSAFVAYGKGSGHPAGLNFGDVFAYALAKSRGSPLLFKGGDFALTDIVSALPSTA